MASTMQHHAAEEVAGGHRSVEYALAAMAVARKATDLPQFAGPQSFRLAHGVLMLVGCCALAWNLRRAGPEATR